MTKPKSPKEYPDIDIFMDEHKRLLFVPLVNYEDQFGASMYKKVFFLEPPYNALTIGKTAKECLKVSAEHTMKPPKNILTHKDLPFPITKEEFDRLDYDWYVVSFGEWPTEYTVRPWRRNGVMDTHVFKLPLDVSDQKLGETILEAFDYIDKNFGFDKFPPKGRKKSKK